jgi:hypothetical protein
MLIQLGKITVVNVTFAFDIYENLLISIQKSQDFRSRASSQWKVNYLLVYNNFICARINLRSKMVEFVYIVCVCACVCSYWTRYVNISFGVYVCLQAVRLIAVLG